MKIIYFLMVDVELSEINNLSRWLEFPAEEHVGGYSKYKEDEHKSQNV